MNEQQYQAEVMDELKQQEENAKMIDFNSLRKINVNEYTEKKGKLTYLSWTYAVDTLLQHDPMATWEFPEPKYFGDSVMVYCNVTAFNKTMKMQLPVMDNYNKAISNPNTRSISDATMRCLAKCIACFGIGLYIYAGSDLPDDDTNEISKNEFNLKLLLETISNSETIDVLEKNYLNAKATAIKANDESALKTINAVTTKIKAKLLEAK